MIARKQIGTFLMRVQVICALVFAIPYFFRLLVDVKGVVIVQIGLTIAYVAFHLALAVGANRVQSSRATLQVIGMYCLWFVLMIPIICAVIFNDAYRWSIQDTTTLVMALLATSVILLIGKSVGLTIADPRIKALLAITYKAAPQVLMAWKVWVEGGSSIPAISVYAGHVTITTRLAQIYLMVQEAGWDRNRVWLAISEAANELSWVIVTIAWLMW